MKNLVQSIYIFGYYIFGTGLVLLITPNFLFDLLGIPDKANILVQLLGLALTALGIYYIKAARDKNLDFIKGTIPIRIGQFGIVSILILTNEVPLVLAAISLVELGFGLWSWVLLLKLK